MKTFALLLLSGAVAFAAIDGTVQNQTSGKQQPGAVVTLIELGSGMNNIGSVKSDAQGRFHFDADMKAGTPYLLQALYEGVTYNRMLPPGTAAGDVSMDVYNAAPKVPDAKVSQDMILLEPTGKELVVNETVIFTNSGKTTLQSPDGSLKIQVPPGSTPVRMRITAPQGMPITREPEKGKEPNTWVVRYPVKPGETRLDFSYSVPAGENPEFKGRILHGGGPVRFVAPQGVKLEGPALTDLGPEPRTKASVYELQGKEFAIRVSGSGQLRSSSEGSDASDQGGTGSSDDNTPGVDMVKPRIYQRLPWVLALGFGMLAVGFVALYTKGSRA